MLTGKQIQREVERGNMVIDPWNPAQLNPNSYNLCWSEKLKIYKKTLPLLEWYKRVEKQREHRRELGMATSLDAAPGKPVLEPLDMSVKEETVDIEIPKEGLLLFPEMLYLAATVEYAGSDYFVPELHGRSSMGRLGVFVHVTAGFGDLGFSGHPEMDDGRGNTIPDTRAQWTLEVVTVHPIRVFAGVQVCQICFAKPVQDQNLGELPRYQGKYVADRGPKASGLWKDFANETAKTSQ